MSAFQKVSAFQKENVEAMKTWIRQHLEMLTNEERLKLFEDLAKGYCIHCGRNDPNCQCWNDE